MKNDELTLEELENVKAGVPISEEEKNSFRESLKVNTDELTLEELEDVKAGMPIEEEKDKEDDEER